MNLNKVACFNQGGIYYTHTMLALNQLLFQGNEKFNSQKTKETDMRDLAPEIIRQRLLIEGIYTIDVNREIVESFLLEIASHLGLRTYGSPIIHAPGSLGKKENQGFDAFIPLIDSGVSLYVWSSTKFFATVLFTCKAFETERAVSYTAKSFGASEIEYQRF